MGSGCFRAGTSQVHPTSLSAIPAQSSGHGTSSSSTAPPPEFTSVVASAGPGASVVKVAPNNAAGPTSQLPPPAAPSGGAPKKPVPKPNLIKAAKDGNLSMAEALLSDPNTDLEKLGMWDNTPLLVACTYGHASIALKLLEANANFLAKNEHGASALHYASVEGSTNLVEALLVRAADSANVEGSPGVQVFVNCGAALIYNRHLDDYAPRTPLASAAESGFAEIVSLLVAAGADLEGCSEEDGCTPLWLACRYTRMPAAQKLLEWKANIEAKDNKGTSVLGTALITCSEDLVLLLLKAGVRDVNDTADPPVLSAVKAGRRYVAEVLISHGAPVQPLSDKPAVTPLHIACEKGDEAMITILARAGADPSRKNLAGQTATELLRRRGLPESHITSLFRVPDPSPKAKPATKSQQAAESKGKESTAKGEAEEKPEQAAESKAEEKVESAAEEKPEQVADSKAEAAESQEKAEEEAEQAAGSQDKAGCTAKAEAESKANQEAPESKSKAEGVSEEQATSTAAVQPPQIEENPSNKTGYEAAPLPPEAAPLPP